MSYSCTDFTDDILNALKIEVPDEAEDSPSDQADLALAEIERLQKAERPGLHFDNQETGIILAGLRMIQRMGVHSDEEDIASGGGEFEPFGDDDIDALCERLNTPVSTSTNIDWRSIARDLAAALQSATGQIEQMRGMFDDADGAIAQALKDADEASEAYTKAAAYLPAAPSSVTQTVWTVTTDGDNMPTETNVFLTEAEAFEHVRDGLMDACKPTQLASLKAMPTEQLSGAWEETYDGFCIVQSHDLPVSAAKPATVSTSPLRLTAVVAAGRLVEIVSDDPGLKGIAYTVLDYDCEGSDRAGTVTRDDGTKERADIAYSQIEQTAFRAFAPACG
jgi:hypothetical protein